MAQAMDKDFYPLTWSTGSAAGPGDPVSARPLGLILPGSLRETTTIRSTAATCGLVTV